MDERLVFDIGMHKGEDTAYYLARGYRVLAVDADERLIERAREVFADAERTGRLVLLHCAVAAEEGEIEFHRSERTLWNSLKKEVSARKNLHQDTVRVPSRRLASLLVEYGVPLYCKIDVEGYDAVCLATLDGAPELPRFISAETECVGEGDRPTDAEALATLAGLHRLGYRRFKLVDQGSLTVLSPGARIYRGQAPLWKRVGKRLGLRVPGFFDHAHLCAENRRRLGELHGHDFPGGASGPFGDDLEGDWLDYGRARDTLLHQRQNYFRMAGVMNYGFWCDWHATF